MEMYEKKNIRKASGGIGFMLICCAIVMVFVSSLLMFVSAWFGYSDDVTFRMLIDIICSILGLFFVGLFYCVISKTPLYSTVRVTRVKFSLFVSLVLIGLCVSMISDYLTNILLSSFSLIGVENHVKLNEQTYNALDNILHIVSVSLVPPLVEEFLFRGVILGKMRRFGDGFALFFSSTIFALMHGNIVQIPFAFIVGLSLGFVTIKTDSLLPAITIHFIVNLRSVLSLVIIDNKILSENTLNYIYLIFIFAIFVSAIFCAAKLSKDREMFRLSQNNVLSFRQCVSAGVTSAGMILFLIYILFSTVSSVL